MYKIKIINFIILLVIFCSCEKIPTEGFKVEGSIANFQDYSSNKVMAFVGGDYPTIGTKISESKLNNNYFSMFLPYEIKDKYCDAVSTKKFILYDDEFESYLTISNENVKIAEAWFNSDKKYYVLGNIKQFGYTEKYNYGVADVTLVRTQYVYAQSAVSITGEYETRLTFVHGQDLYKTVKMNLFLQKGWNIIYYVGNYTSKPNTYYWEVDTAIVNKTTEKPENIELKWYYRLSQHYYDILKNENAQFIYMPYISSYYIDLIFRNGF